MSTTRLTVSDGLPPRVALEAILNRLHEAHHVSAYEAVDRLVRAGETAGYDVNALLGMLDQGIGFQKLLNLIVSKSVPSSTTPPKSKRNPGPARATCPEQVLKQVVVA
jgi:hypothetical protein